MEKGQDQKFCDSSSATTKYFSDLIQQPPCGSRWTTKPSLGLWGADALAQQGQTGVEKLLAAFAKSALVSKIRIGKNEQEAQSGAWSVVPRDSWCVKPWKATLLPDSIQPERASSHFS